MKDQQPVRTGLTVYNTLTRRQEPFRSREEGRVKMFTCGPSIYSRPHLGNYRTFLFEDVLQRYLEYSGYEVDRVINFTDVEDKAIEAARRQNLTLEELTEGNARRFREEAVLLHIQLPRFIPRSSTSVAEAVEIIKVLVEKGYAYWHQGDVFYEPLKFEGFGKLYRLDLSKWPRRKKRFRKDTYPGQRWNLGDFILWHGCRQEDCYGWDTEIGRGRPAWNVQDPAMISKHLGWEIDVSCGGVDNLFRHHDYNIAVMEAVSGRKFAEYWLHGEHVLVDGRKMSKSRGNIIYLEELLANGFTPRHLRFFLLRTHYRRKLDFTETALEEARQEYDDLQTLVREIKEENAGEAAETEGPAGRLREIFESRLDDDLDVGGAMAALHLQLARLVRRRRERGLSAREIAACREDLARIDQVLQIL